jgi:prophage regulatory protein
LKVISFDQLEPKKGIRYCRDHLRRKIRAGEFPKPVALSDRRIAWIEAEVDEWLATRAASREPPETPKPR